MPPKRREKICNKISEILPLQFIIRLSLIIPFILGLTGSFTVILIAFLLGGVFFIPHIVRRGIPPVVKITMLSCLFGLAGGICAGILSRYSLPVVTLRGDRIEKLCGILSDDSFLTASGYTRLDVNIDSYVSFEGIKTSGNGSIQVYVKTDENFMWGEKVECLLGGGIDSSGGETAVFARSVGRRGWRSGLFALRSRISMSIEWLFSLVHRSAPLMKALCTGNRDDLSSPVTVFFKRSGCAHILALSGMHIGFIGGILLLAIRPLFNRMTGFFVFSAVIVLFWFLVGPSPSLTRAVIMSEYTLFRSVRGKKIDLSGMLLFAFFSMSILSPASIASASFQFSFGALFGIILLGTPVRRGLLRIMPACIASPLSMSISAVVITAPLQIHYFGCFYPVGIVAGIIVTPVVFVFMSLSILLAAVSLCGLPGICEVLWILLDRCYDILMGVLRFFSNFPPLRPSPGIVISLIALIFVLLIVNEGLGYYRVRKWKKRSIITPRSPSENISTAKATD